MIQFWHSIYIASLSGGSTRRMVDHGKMEPEYAVQGFKDSVFFAEKSIGRSDIYMLKLAKSSLKAVKRLIFELPAKMVAMENDNSNQNIQQDKDHIKSAIFVLGNDQKLRHLQELEKDKLFVQTHVYDYTGYDMRALILNGWSQCHMNPGAITSDEFIFRANNDFDTEQKGKGCFYWPVAKHQSQLTTLYSVDDKHDLIALERVKVQQVTDSTTMIAVGRELKRKLFYECGNWFILRPGPSHREYSVFAEERRAANECINLMSFVTNNHMLTQFNKISPTDEHGRIVTSFKKNETQVNKRKTITF